MTQARNVTVGVLAFFALEIILFGFIDLPLSKALRAVDANHHAVINFFRAWTDFGKSKWFLVPSALVAIGCAVGLRRPIDVALRPKLRRTGEFCLFLFVCVAAAGIVTDIIKPILGRARPVEWDRDELYGFFPFTFDARWNSMPSGHATAVFAFALIVTEFFPRFRIHAFAIAATLALSRIMVNAHYASDILAGGAIAFLTFVTLKKARHHNGIFHMIESIFPIDAPPAKK